MQASEEDSITFVSNEKTSYETAKDFDWVAGVALYAGNSNEDLSHIPPVDPRRPGANNYYYEINLVNVHVRTKPNVKITGTYAAGSLCM